MSILFIVIIFEYDLFILCLEECAVIVIWFLFMSMYILIFMNNYVYLKNVLQVYDKFSMLCSYLCLDYRESRRGHAGGGSAQHQRCRLAHNASTLL
jgi:hypothetical protein